jgi:PTS system nitrogen regulatory IIA component
MNFQKQSAPYLPEHAGSAKSPCKGTAMDLADLIEPVVFAARASNKQQLLQDLASRVATLLNLDGRVIFDALQAREQLGSTGLGAGFALPHARVEGLDRLFGMFTRLNRPIHFDSIDGKPVDLVFLLLIPPTAGSEHLGTCCGFTGSARPRVRSESSQGGQRHCAIQSSVHSATFMTSQQGLRVEARYYFRGSRSKFACITHDVCLYCRPKSSNTNGIRALSRRRRARLH